MQLNNNTKHILASKILPGAGGLMWGAAAGLLGGFQI